MSSVKEEVQDLVNKMLEDTLSTAEKARLHELLNSSADARKIYLEACQLHAILSERYGALAGNSIERPLAKKSSKSIVLWSWLTLVAALLISFVVMKDPKKNTIPSGEIVKQEIFRGKELVTLEKSIMAEFAYGGKNGSLLLEGDTLLEGLYKLQRGLIKLKYENGTSLVLEAPCEFELVSKTLISCNNGKISASVSPQAKYFTVEVPGVSVVDLGTEFSIWVKGKEFMETHVFKGRVEMQLHYENGDQKSQLTAGQALRILFGAGGPVPAGIDMKSDFFVRQLSEPESAYSKKILEFNPVVYLPMEMNSDGKTLNDWSQYKNHGLAAHVRKSSSLWVLGKIGSAIQLSGSNAKAYFYVPNYPKAKENRLSVMAWVYAESRPQWATIVKNWGSGKWGQFHFGLNIQGKLDIELWPEDSKPQHLAEEEEVFPLNSWQHVAFIHDGKNVKLFRNGKLVASRQMNGMNIKASLKALGIGTKLGDRSGEFSPAVASPGHWDGRLDEVALFNDALSEEDIKDFYEMSK